MRKLQLSMLALLIIMLASCKKEEVPTVTKSTGMVIERSTDEPLAGIKVAVSNGQRDLVKTTTDADGNFELAVDFDRVTENDSLLLDGSPDLPSRKFELKGFGKAEYNYGRLWLYDKSDENQLPTVTTDSIVNVGSTIAEVAGTVASDGGFDLIERGICYATHQSPTLNDSIRAAGSEMGYFTCRLSGLELNTTYYVRAYATNSIGTKYGGQMSFTTISGLAEVITGEAIEVSALSAVLGGNVLDDGGYAIMKRGVCYGQTPMPSFADNVKEAGGVNETGEFTCEVDGLIPTTNYYFRAFAINVVDTVFGTTKSFRTTDGKPSVVTANATNVTETSAILGGEVTNDGGYSVTKRGVCYARHQSPGFNDITVVCGSGTGIFSQDVTNLTPLAVYYCRAFAINAIDTVFGEQKSFTAINGMPSVTTSQVTNILPTSATAGGVVTDDGGHNVTERGVCWTTLPNHEPGISDEHATSGSGLGNFVVQMMGLSHSTKYYVRAYAKNSEGTSYGEKVSFTTLSISSPTISLDSIGNITPTTVSCYATVASDGGAGVTERGICWSVSPNPTTSSYHSNSGTGEGSFVVQITGLSHSTRYFVRAYAINSAKGVSYSNEMTVTTQIISQPMVTTLPVSNMTRTSATGNGRVDSDGGAAVTERGVCWGISHNPDVTGNHATNGIGEGVFSVQINNLNPNTKYYVRAYAKNSEGTEYGGELNFTTEDISLPSVTTAAVSGISQTSATGGGNVIDDGGGTIIERGVCCGSSIDPDINGTHFAASGSGMGSFSVSMTNLTPSTNYYVRAYARNSKGIKYGDNVTFRTLSEPSAPLLTTLDVTNIMTSTALGGGNITDDGGFTIAERGLCWAKVHNPNTSHNYLSCGSGEIGVFNGAMTGLEPGTTYYVRAYARNSFGERYGNEVSFTTAMPPTPVGAIGGLFTVGVDYYSGVKQVWFAQGNLQYQASSNLWRFAENQWDYIGEANANISQTYSGWIDLFGWATSGYNHGAICWQPWSVSTNDENYKAYGGNYSNLYDDSGQADWGYNEISNGGNQPNQWRTLNNSEWEYVFFTRNTPSTIRFAMAIVNGVNGVILLPDNWNTNTYALNNINDESSSYSSNVFSSSVWSAVMQPAGVVFFPAAGSRMGNTVTKVGVYGYYWSSKRYRYHTSNQWHYHAYELRFFNDQYSNGLYPGTVSSGGSYGTSVRLVQDY